jgi:hypothetical protein
MMRSRLGWFVKGLPHAAGFRESIKSIASEAQTIDTIEKFRMKLNDHQNKRVAPRTGTDSQPPFMAN